MSHDKALFFKLLHIEIGWLDEGINTESAKKMQNVLIKDQFFKELKIILLQTFLKVHINVKLIKCQWLVFFVPSCQAPGILQWNYL